MHMTSVTQMIVLLDQVTKTTSILKLSVTVI
jgi:hypothetical protein